MKLRDRLYSFVYHINGHIFVGGMNSVAFKAKTHQHRFYAQNFLKITDNRNASSASHRSRFFAKSLFKAFLCSLVCVHVDRAYIAFAPMQRSDFHLHIFGRDRFDIVGK